MVKIIPSILARNKSELLELFKKFEGVSPVLHLDIADGKFVPSKSLWFPFRLPSRFTYAAHLMVRRPIKWLEKHGHKVDQWIVAAEVLPDIQKYLSFCAKKKKKVILALNPETPITKLQKYLSSIDELLILTVHPGFYGARFLRSPLDKISLIKQHNPKIKVHVDGGMIPETVAEAVSAGADYLVSGSYIFTSENPRKAIRQLRSKAHK